MVNRTAVFALIGMAFAWVLLGCNSALPTGGEPAGVTAEVAAKAQQIAGEVGGPTGFGGQLMMGYFGHMAPHMGFDDQGDLADPHGQLLVQLTNSSGFPCTFHLAYLQSSAGLDEQTQDVVVQPGNTIQVQLPCAEIMGVGSLTDVGAVAVDLPDGTGFDNRYCVPGFLNSDYACGGAYGCVVAPDVNDLDQDGDTAELIVLTSGMRSHMSPGGMGRHMVDDEGGYNGMMPGGWWMMGGTDRSSGPGADMTRP